jgi:hypothetical protein
VPAVATPIVVTSPELVFAERVPAPEPRPRPAVRRGIFFDVENSSRPEHVSAVLRYLKIDWTAHATELIAVGNWRVASPETARLLAEQGAQLVHSAPASGVRDWSDLRIAVGAGAWLASARPGDIIELITDDQAFDAVGDAAASLGVVYRRLSYRQLSGLGELAVEAPRASSSDSSGGRRGRRRGGRRGRPDGRQESHGARSHARQGAGSHRPPAAAPAVSAPPPAAAAVVDDEGHTAPADEIRGLLHELLESSPSGVTLDALANALKSRGFRRTPGSPRLITRLKNLKGVEVTRAGVVRLVGGAAAPVETPALLHPPAQLAGMPEDEDAQPVPLAVSAPPLDDEAGDDDEGPGPGNERDPSASPASDSDSPAAAGAADPRRRRRRGGRRWRGRRGRGGEGGAPAVQQAS